MHAHLNNLNNHKVAFVLTQGFADWEYALVAGIGKAFYGLEVAFFSPETRRLVSKGGWLLAQ